VRVFAGPDKLWRVVKSGSSYLSQSELPVTFGLGARTTAERLVVEWPSGVKDEVKNVNAGELYTITEGMGITAREKFKP
jgi:enediyne biosynthesis protein E4